MSEPTNSQNVERGVEETRAKLSDTLHQIGERVSPGRLVDDAVRFARDSGASDWARGAGRTVREHPLPFLLMGAGLGWFIASRVRHRDGDARALARDPAQALQGKAYEAGERIGERAAEASLSAKDRLAQARGKASELAARAGDSVGEAARGARHGAVRGWTWATEEQPLALLGLGLAAGAAIGFALPRSRQEDRLFGRSSAALKGRVRETAREGYDRACSAAQDAYQTAIDDLDRRGLSADSLRDAAGAAAEQARAALGGEDPAPARH